MRRPLRIAVWTGSAVLLVLFAWWAFVCWARYVTSPHEARPMFHEWEGTDRGWAWKMGPDISDRRGIWVFADRTLNMLVVVVTNDPDLHAYRVDAHPGHATVLGDTPYATFLRPMPDALYIVVFPGRAELRVQLDPGIAKRFYDRFAYAGYPESDLLARVLEMYEGNDRAELEEFVRLHSPAASGDARMEAAVSGASQPSKP